MGRSRERFKAGHRSNLGALGVRVAIARLVRPIVLFFEDRRFPNGVGMPQCLSPIEAW